MKNFYKIVSLYAFAFFITSQSLLAEVVPLGRGYDSKTERYDKQDCVDGQIYNEPNTVLDSEITIITSSYELAQAMGISAEAAWKIAAGRGNFSAKHELFKSYSASENSVYVLAKAKVLTGVMGLKDPILKPRFVKLIKDPAKFKRICGDGFARQLEKGGEFYSLVKIETNSREDSQAIKSSLKLDFKAYIARGSASIEAGLTDSLKTKVKSIKSTILSTGTDGLRLIPIDDAEVQAEYQNFQKNVQAYPVVLKTENHDYSILGLADDHQSTNMNSEQIFYKPLLKLFDSIQSEKEKLLFAQKQMDLVPFDIPNVMTDLKKCRHVDCNVSVSDFWPCGSLNGKPGVKECHIAYYACCGQSTPLGEVRAEFQSDNPKVFYSNLDNYIAGRKLINEYKEKLLQIFQSHLLECENDDQCVNKRLVKLDSLLLKIDNLITNSESQRDLKQKLIDELGNNMKINWQES